MYTCTKHSAVQRCKIIPRCAYILYPAKKYFAFISHTTDSLLAQNTSYPMRKDDYPFVGRLQNTKMRRGRRISLSVHIVPHHNEVP